MTRTYRLSSLAAGLTLVFTGASHAQQQKHSTPIRDGLTVHSAPILPGGEASKSADPTIIEYPMTAREYASMMMEHVFDHVTNEPFGLQGATGQVGSCECFWDNGAFDSWNGQGSAQGAAFTGRCADDFYLPECSVYRLDEVSAVMLVDSPNSAPSAFLEIYADCNGRPAGDPIGTYDMISSQLLGNFIGGLQVWEFTFDTSSCNLRGGNTYWVSPVGIGDGSGDDVYYFATTTAPAGGVQLNQGHFTKPEGFVTFPDWTPVQVTNVKKRDFAFAVCVTECELLWDNGQADFTRDLHKNVSANLPNYRAADNFALAPCQDWTLCMVEVCILTSCECAIVSMEIYETDPITMLPVGAPIVTATDPKVFDLGFSMNDNTGVLVRAKRLQFGAGLDLNEPLAGGKTYWISIVEGGTLSGTDRLYFCYSYKCDKPDDCQISITEAAFYKPVLGEWQPYSQFVDNGHAANELAFAVFGEPQVADSDLVAPDNSDRVKIYAGDGSSATRRTPGSLTGTSAAPGAGSQ